MFGVALQQSYEDADLFGILVDLLQASFGRCSQIADQLSRIVNTFICSSGVAGLQFGVTGLLFGKAVLLFGVAGLLFGNLLEDVAEALDAVEAVFG